MKDELRELRELCLFFVCWERTEF